MSTAARTARELRDEADKTLREATGYNTSKLGYQEHMLKLAHELSCLADVTHAIEGTEHYREQERREETESKYRKLAEKYEAALNSILNGVTGPTMSDDHRKAKHIAREALEMKP